MARRRINESAAAISQLAVGDDVQIVMVPMAEIRPYENNPRIIPERAVNAVVASIERYGFQQPLVLDAGKVIVVGHTRFMAAQRLGIEQVPCVVRGFTREEAAAYRLVDNKAAEQSLWDRGKLATELRIGDLEALEPVFGPGVGDLMRVDSLAEHTDSEFTDYADRRDNLFGDRARMAISEYVDLECPHCGAGVSVRRRDLLERPEEG